MRFYAISDSLIKRLSSSIQIFQESKNKAFSEYGALPHRPTKGLSDRPLETFGHKHFFLFSKYLRRYPNSPIARLPGEYQEFRLFFSLQQGTLYRTCAALSSALFVRVCGGKNPQRSAALVFIGQIPHHLQANPRAVPAPEGRADHALPLDAADDAGQIE